MKSLSAYASTSLEWKQPRSGQRYWELVSGDELVATLVFDSVLDSMAILQTVDGEWQMRRERGVSRDVLIYESDSPDPIGHYHPQWTGKHGVLNMQNNREYIWTATNFWNTRFEIRDSATDNVLFRYIRDLHWEGFEGTFKVQAMMQVHSTMLRSTEQSLLSGWGFYQLILLRNQALRWGKNSWFMFAAPRASSTRARKQDR